MRKAPTSGKPRPLKPPAAAVLGALDRDRVLVEVFTCGRPVRNGSQTIEIQNMVRTRTTK